jgi:hypothetical protein
VLISHQDGKLIVTEPSWFLWLLGALCIAAPTWLFITHMPSQLGWQTLAAVLANWALALPAAGGVWILTGFPQCRAEVDLEARTLTVTRHTLFSRASQTFQIARLKQVIVEGIPRGGQTVWMLGVKEKNGDIIAVSSHGNLNRGPVDEAAKELRKALGIA